MGDFGRPAFAAIPMLLQPGSLLMDLGFCVLLTFYFPLILLLASARMLVEAFISKLSRRSNNGSGLCDVPDVYLVFRRHRDCDLSFHLTNGKE